MTDPPDREHAAAVAEIAALIAPRLLPGIDADRLADRAVTALRDRGWRHIPRTPRIPERPPRDPAAAHRGAALARQYLGLPARDTEGDT